MQPDVKTGLAVGLALVGLVGMMFFRRDPPLREEPLAALENLAEIDGEIAEAGRSPYANVIDDVSDQPSAGSAGTVVAHRTQKAPFDAEAALDMAAEQATVADVGESGMVQGSAKAPRDAESETDPLRPPVANRRESATETGPSHNRDWQPVPRKASPGAPTAEAVSGTAKSPRGGTRTHTIQAGETLSGIAEQHYGARRYYRQIYEANRDRLRGVDDVPEGVTLVLPEIAGSDVRNPSPSRDLPPGFEPPRTRTSLSDEDSGEDPLRSTRARPEKDGSSFKLSFEPVRPRSAKPGATGQEGASRRSPAVEPAVQIEELEFDNEADDDEEPPLSSRGRRR